MTKLDKLIVVKRVRVNLKDVSYTQICPQCDEDYFYKQTDIYGKRIGLFGLGGKVQVTKCPICRYENVVIKNAVMILPDTVAEQE